ncbi:hypothetical protein FIBSPDRAFT_946312 [Athelia psychrophila]|uniref:Uncharacterized protein n=1 Tax=Athelia psychrophila TaxID=1759441 RepID=A0A166T664_9AGAM|nr:hypothetical protein FIBSPDRAFT_946312 [Fibularhizoctonia sp. CBS 109695]
MKHTYGYVEQHVDINQEALPVVLAEVVLQLREMWLLICDWLLLLIVVLWLLILIVWRERQARLVLERLLPFLLLGSLLLLGSEWLLLVLLLVLLLSLAVILLVLARAMGIRVIGEHAEQKGQALAVFKNPLLVLEKHAVPDVILSRRHE